jgi:hypothetical protein
MLCKRVVEEKINEPAIVATPTMSIGSLTAGLGTFGIMSTQDIAIVRAMIAMLQKIQCQLANWVNVPPSIRPPTAKKNAQW